MKHVMFCSSAESSYGSRAEDHGQPVASAWPPCVYQGRAHVVRHCDKSTHKKMATLVKSSRTITVMFASASSAVDLVLKDQTMIENTT